MKKTNPSPTSNKPRSRGKLPAGEILANEIDDFLDLLAQVKKLSQESQEMAELLDILEAVGKSNTRLVTLLKAESAFGEDQDLGQAVREAVRNSMGDLPLLKYLRERGEEGEPCEPLMDPAGRQPENNEIPQTLAGEPTAQATSFRSGRRPPRKPAAGLKTIQEKQEEKSVPQLLEPLLQKVERFTPLGGRLRLRDYQRQVAERICESVLQRQGHSFVVMFPRQSGKNEIQAQIEAYLLSVLDEAGAEIVKISPTWKPQSINAMRRLERVLKKNTLLAGRWEKESGFILRVGEARIFFFSGSPEANIVGATASTLLEVDEAQEIEIGKFDKDIAPMAASTNATRVFWGTAWTSRTLLARELRAAREAERLDGWRRAFVVTAEDVAKEVPSYGAFVAEQVAKLGRSNPTVRTQFFCEEIDAEGGMFPPDRVALMAGGHPALSAPGPGEIYCLLVDVAGEDEGATGQPGELANPGRDATALTMVRANLVTLGDPILKAPTFEVVHRWLWVGKKQSQLYTDIRAIVEAWRCRWVVGDATGVGAGLISFLQAAFGEKVIPFTFNAATKSKLGWDFLAMVDAGRFKDHAAVSNQLSAVSKKEGGGDMVGQPGSWNWHQAQFYNELSFCEYEVTPGPARHMKWGVKDGTRDPASGELVHDDLVLSAALCAVLDELPGKSRDWGVTGPGLLIQGVDPLDEKKGKRPGGGTAAKDRW